APSLVAGHSLGEYTALVAAGSIPLGTAVRWVKHRGRSMQQAVPAGLGGMAAVIGLEDSQVDQLCERATSTAQEARRAEGVTGGIECIVAPANFNSPGQVVIAGSADAIAAVSKAAPEFAG